jgi:hypothetical protein
MNKWTTLLALVSFGPTIPQSLMSGSPEVMQ